MRSEMDEPINKLAKDCSDSINSIEQKLSDNQGAVNMGSELKLFIWEGDGVLQDWSSGMICVLAHDHSEALKLIEQKCHYCMTSFPVNGYKVIEEPEAFICWGGG